MKEVSLCQFNIWPCGQCSVFPIDKINKSVKCDMPFSNSPFLYFSELTNQHFQIEHCILKCKSIGVRQEYVPFCLFVFLAKMHFDAFITLLRLKGSYLRSGLPNVQKVLL